MSFRIATNTSAMESQRYLRRQVDEQGNVSEKMSSGARITKAADDAAGLSISEKMKSKVRGLGQAIRNANDGISMIQVAEGGLSRVADILVRLKELNVQAASDTMSSDERSMINREYQTLKNEMDRLANATEFNGKKLLNGSGKRYDFQIGMNDSKVDRIHYDAGMMNSTTAALGMSGASVVSKESAQLGLGVIERALDKVSKQRSELGSLQVRLGTTNNNLSYYNENLQTSQSQIRDADYAKLTADKVKLDITTSAGTSVMSQANNAPSAALSLLG